MNDDYFVQRRRGPFPGRIDPWAEAGRYFHQIHAGMIGHLLEQIQEPVEVLGYLAGRETSLQIAERREPDLYVRRGDDQPAAPRWNYALAAEEALAEPGVALEMEPSDLQAITVRRGDLVTVVEIISPRNKADSRVIHEYQERRDRLIRRGVNVVEIDLTRSVMRLVADRLVDQYPYHVAVHLPGEPVRFIGIDVGLPRVALPLRGEVVPMAVGAAYDHAYQVARIAVHILDETGYAADALPFPSLLSERADALAAVAAWRAGL